MDARLEEMEDEVDYLWCCSGDCDGSGWRVEFVMVRVKFFFFF